MPSTTAKSKCFQSSVIPALARYLVTRCSLVPSHEPAGDDRPLHLGGALVDPRRPHLTIEPLEQVAALESPRAVQLDRLVDDPLRRLGREQLGLGRTGGDVRACPRWSSALFRWSSALVRSSSA